MQSSGHCLSFALVDSRPVFMDAAADSYFLLEPGAEADFLHSLEQSAPGEAGLTLDSDADPSFAQKVRWAACRRPDRSLLDALLPERPGLADIFRTGAILRKTRRQLARAPIRDVLQGLEGPDEGCPHAPREEQAARAMPFLNARRLVPIATNCLLDSVALLRWLGPSRQGLCLVFGVKLDPFAAHCWVQDETMLFNDRAEHVRRFEPVRVVQCSARTH